MRSGILLLTLQLAGNSFAACHSTESTCSYTSRSSSEDGISLSMQNLADDMAKLYAEFEDEVVWLLKAKLGTGTADERYAVLQVFSEERIFALIDQVIYSTTDSSRVRIAPGQSVKVSEYAERALVSVARQVGLWKEDYRKLYDNGSVENWKALFWDFQREFVVPATTVSYYSSSD